MKFKPFLLHRKDKGSFSLIHIDTTKVQRIQPMYDSMQMVNLTKNSPLKNIKLEQKPIND